MNNSWVPISKGFRYLLPHKGAFSKLEAALSLQLDFDEKKNVSIAGYSKQWGWSRDKVRKFLEDMEVDIIYPEDTKSKQNQRGSIKKTDQKTDNRQIEKQIKLIDINKLKNNKNRPKNRKPTDRPYTTIDPIDPNPRERENIPRTQYADFVFLSHGEHEDLIRQLGEEKTQHYIKRVDYQIGSRGKKYINHHRTILSWAKEDGAIKSVEDLEQEQTVREQNAKIKYREMKNLNAGKTAEEDIKLKKTICKNFNVSEEIFNEALC